MDSQWRTIEQIMECDIEYEEFRSRTKEFLSKNAISLTLLSIETGISRPVLIAFLRNGHRNMRFRTLSKLFNFMQDYRK